jgi:phosphate transport system permease protein
MGVKVAFRLKRFALTETLFAVVVAASGYFLVAVVGLIFVFVFSQARPALNHVSPWAFLTGTRWLPVSDPPVFGIAPFLLGFALIVTCALAVGIPLGLAVASIWLRLLLRESGS